MKRTIPLPAAVLLLALSACQPGNTAAPAAASAATAAASAPAPAAAVFRGTNLSKDNIGGDFTLTDGQGKPFSLSSLKGKAVILAFGFTNCPDVCPTELLTYSDVLKQLGGQAEDVAVVFVSVDPERDTPELVGKYAAQFNPAFIGLSDTSGGRNLALAKQLYNVVSAKTEIRSDKLYNVDHSTGAFLIDKQGRAAVFEPYGADAAQIAADLRILLAQPAS